MKKTKSQKESIITQFYFALYPFSLSFPQPNNNRYILYLQKSLQILNKYELQGNQQNKTIYCNQIQKSKSFRILSQKNLIYKWSLYLSKGSQGQQFLQSQNIDLSSFWNEFLIKKQNIKPYQITFNKIKIKLFYLTAAGNIKQIKDNLLKYTQAFINPSNHTQITNKQSIKQSISNKNQQNSAISLNKIKSKQFKQNTIKQIQRLQSTVVDIKIQNNDDITPTRIKPFIKQTTSYVKQKDVSQIKLGSGKQNYSSLSKSQAQMVGQSLHSPLRLSLSIQQQQISKQIQKRIKQVQFANRDPLISKQLSVVKPPKIQQQIIAKYRQQKSKRITSSQKLNQKGDIIITPFYYHIKYYVVILLIFMIFLGLINLNPQSIAAQPQIYKPNKKTFFKGENNKKKSKRRK